MLRIRLHVCAAAALIATPLCLDIAPPAMAGEFVTDTAPVAQSTATGVIIRGKKGDTFTIAYTDAAGVARTKTVTLTKDNFPQRTTVPAGKGTKITITNTSEPKVPAQTEKSLAFAPGPQKAVTVLAINPGSTLSAFGRTFGLGGTFRTVATSYDINPASAGYGSLTGYIPSAAFDVVAGSGPQQIDLSLNGSGPLFSLNVAPVLNADLPDTGIAVPFTQPLAGLLTFMGSTLPFTGDASGTVTFFTDNLETIAGDLVLDGIGSGAFSATGRTAIVPEPNTLLLLGSALLLAMAQRWRSGAWP